MILGLLPIDNEASNEEEASNASMEFCKEDEDTQGPPRIVSTGSRDNLGEEEEEEEESVSSGVSDLMQMIDSAQQELNEVAAEGYSLMSASDSKKRGWDTSKGDDDGESEDEDEASQPQYKRFHVA